MYQRFEAGKMSGVFLPKLPAPIIRRRSNEPSPALAIEVRSALRGSCFVILECGIRPFSKSARGANGDAQGLLSSSRRV